MRIYRCRETQVGDDERIDTNMRRIIQLVDGRKSLASIAFASGMSMSDFQKSMKALIDLKLIVPLDPKGGLPD